MKSKGVKIKPIDHLSQDVVSRLISLLTDEQLLEFDTWYRIKFGNPMQQFLKEKPMILDDQIPDAFDRWLNNLESK